jgi:hypothetical protein
MEKYAACESFFLDMTFYHIMSLLPPSLNDGRSGSVFVREIRFSRDNHLETEWISFYFGRVC